MSNFEKKTVFGIISLQENVTHMAEIFHLILNLIMFVCKVCKKNKALLFLEVLKIWPKSKTEVRGRLLQERSNLFPKIKLNICQHNLFMFKQ